MQKIYVVLHTTKKHIFSENKSCGYFETFELASNYISYQAKPGGYTIVEAQKGDTTVKEKLSARTYKYNFTPNGVRKIELIPYLPLDQLNKYEEHNPHDGYVSLDADSGTEEELKAQAIKIYEDSKYLKKFYSLVTGFQIRYDTVDVDICLDKILFLNEIEVYRDFNIIIESSKTIALYSPSQNLILIPYMDNSISQDALRYIHEEYITQNKAILNKLFLDQFKYNQSSSMIVDNFSNY
jgi:hypothetical protein